MLSLIMGYFLSRDLANFKLERHKELDIIASLQVFMIATSSLLY